MSLQEVNVTSQICLEVNVTSQICLEVNVTSQIASWRANYLCAWPTFGEAREHNEYNG
jgi:hypothetical protein